MLYIDETNLKITGDSSEVMLELARLLVSYQYCFDVTANKGERSVDDLSNTLECLSQIAKLLYNDDEYYKFVRDGYTNITNTHTLQNVFKAIKSEEE